MTGKLTTVLIVAVVGVPALLAHSEFVALVERLARGHAGTELAVGGLLAGSGLYGFVFCRCDSFWPTVHHEFAHACAAVLVGGKPSQMLVNGGSGHLRWSLSGPFSEAREFVVTIASYCFSPINMGIAVIFLVVRGRNAAFVFLAAMSAGVGLSCSST